jgi:hypothetical protein
MLRAMRLLAAALCLISLSCAKRDLPALEKQFSESMSGVTLAGRFSGHGKDLKEDKYEIESVSKIQGNLWLFKVRIVYENHDVTLPLPLTVEWAGDTPVITLTDVAVPGLGTFTARVLIYRGEYAGTWRGKSAGGHLFGKIVKTVK